jgi:hypothetical protein
MAAREPYEVRPPEPWHRADRASRFIAGWTPICRRYAMTRRAAPSSTASSRVGSTATPASSQPKAPRSSRPILTIRRTPPTFCSPSPRSRRGALRLRADPYAVVPAMEATHDHPAGHRPLPFSPACAGIGAVTASNLCSRARTSPRPSCCPHIRTDWKCAAGQPSDRRKSRRTANRPTGRRLPLP